MRCILAAVAAAVLFAGDLGGKVGWAKDLAWAKSRARLERRPLLYFFGDSNCRICQGLSDGALSSEAVVAAARKMFPILVDCTDPEANAELKKEFGVEGVPTLVLADPDGKKMGEIESKDADKVLAALTEALRKHPGVAVLWARSLDEAVEKAKSERKPLGIYFHDGTEDPSKLMERIAKDLGPRGEKCAWFEIAASNDEKDAMKVKYGYESLPCFGILDPRMPDPASKPLGMIEVLKGDKAETLNKYIDKAMGKYKK